MSIDLKSNILKINNYILKPFYNGIKLWPFNIIFKKYSINKQIVINYNKYFSRFYNKKQLINIKVNNYNFDLICQGNRGSVEMDIIIGNSYESEISDFLMKNIKNSDIFVDIGSNIGYYTILASKLLKNNSKIICFEPISETYERLLKNIKINDINNIVTYNIALGCEKLVKTIGLVNDLSHNSLIHTTAIHSNVCKTESIIVDKLDNIIFEKNKNIFIKIDVEGFELEVFKGMISLLKNNKCKIIYEFSPIFYKHIKCNKNYYHEYLIFELINKLNYKIYQFDKGSLTNISDTNDFIKNLNNVEQISLYASN